jgi:hypothetical protein
MHLIPQSWSHVHILLSVFPPLGLFCVLGFYLGGRRANSDPLKTTCFALIGLMGLSALPIYLSGSMSMAALAGNPRVAEASLQSHYVWGLAALGVLVLAGLAAGLALHKARNLRERVRDPRHLVVGLAGLALVLTAVASELGLHIHHRELALLITIPDISTSQAWSHAHLILNHIPTAGFVFALAFFAVALAAGSDTMKRGSLVLFIICALAGVPAYVAGTAAMWALTQPPIPDMNISLAVINSHRDMALLTLIGLAATGAAAWIELWHARHRGGFAMRPLQLVLVLALIALGLMTETGHRGGLINHPEIVLAGEILPTAAAGISISLETGMANMTWFLTWQIVHFLGYCLIFGAVVAVAARVLGFLKSVPYAGMHRLLALGMLGVLMNVVSGMLMMLSDSYRYVVSDVAFAPKIVFLFAGAVAVLYFSASDRLWNLKPGETAPMAARWVAAFVVLAWTGVIVLGRMLPYL